MRVCVLLSAVVLPVVIIAVLSVILPVVITVILPVVLSVVLVVVLSVAVVVVLVVVLPVAAVVVLIVVLPVAAAVILPVVLSVVIAAILVVVLSVVAAVILVVVLPVIWAVILSVVAAVIRSIVLLVIITCILPAVIILLSAVILPAVIIRVIIPGIMILLPVCIGLVRVILPGILRFRVKFCILVIRVYFTHYDIAASLLTYRDGIIAIRLWNTDEQDIFNFPDVFDKVQIWNMLCCYMVPDILIAAFAVQCNFSKKILYEQKPYISLADKLLVKILQKGMAENHLHFKAGFDYEAIWLNYMNLEKLSRNYSFEKEKRENIWAASVFRILAARFFRDKERAADTGVIAWAAERESAEAEMILQGLLSGEIELLTNPLIS